MNMQKSDFQNLGVIIKGVVGNVSSFNAKDKKTYYRIRVWDGGNNTLSVVSEKNGLDQGSLYHGKVMLSVREYQGRPSLSCYEIERL